MCTPKHTKKTPKNTTQHDNEHAVWNRRSFLQALGLASVGSLVLGKIPVHAATATPLSLALSQTENDRVLVIVRLKGGNDGLNTIIPTYDFGTYANLRPNLKIDAADSFALNDEFSMPNYMNPLEAFWGDGKMKVVHGVGYPNQNLSHFSSADLWSSAADNGSPLQTGVLGRYFEELYPDYLVNTPEIPPAIQIGSLSNLLFNGEENSYAFSVANPDQLAQIAQNGTAYDMQNLPPCDYGDQLGFMRSVTNSTYTYASVIHTAYQASTNTSNYNANDIAEQLAIVARLIKGNLGTKIYMVTLDGFDTHANQPDKHQELMGNLTTAISNFYADLASGNKDSDVLTMTISEFGRRPEENASSGTDHGAAAPMLLFGEGLNGNGFVGNHPDLDNFDTNGNLDFTTDFRDVYASILEDWLCIDSTVVDNALLNTYNRSDLGILCNGNTTPIDYGNVFTHQPIYKDDSVYVSFTVPNATTVKVELINMLGQNLGILHHEHFLTGKYEVNLNPNHVARGQYIYRITANGTSYSKSVALFK